jgi:hypothetical protein
LGPVGVGDEEVVFGCYCGGHGIHEVFRHWVGVSMFIGG